LNWSQDSLVSAITKTHQAGLQTHIHAIGDKGVEIALEAIAEAETGFYRPIIAHAELTNNKLIEKAKNHQVILCMQPFWAQYNSMLSSCSVHLGEHRVDSLYSIRSMLDANLNVSFSSDWPVSSYKPLDGITVAVHRRFNKEQKPHNETEAIALEQALDCYTTSVSQMFNNKSKGTLEIGKFFDAVLLSKDLTKQNLDGYLATEVLAVYSKGSKLFPHNDH
jgi:predicted amidohydrolase YtcJ